MKTAISIVQTICIIALLGCCILNQITIRNYKEICVTWQQAYDQMVETKDTYQEMYEKMSDKYYDCLTKGE